MSSKWIGIEFIEPQVAQSRIKMQMVRILDVREAWETEVAQISGAEHLTEALLGELARATKRNDPVLLYCHFGVRSTDFAVKLKEWGYEKVWVLRGGIDAWAQTVDPRVPRYEGSWC